MPRLLVNPGAASAWEIELKNGDNFIGRGYSNDFKINDTSVSGTHCQITVGETVTIKDLGSTNGTYVDRQPVQQATLRNGQTLQLGGVPMVFYLDAPPPATSPAPPLVRMTNVQRDSLTRRAPSAASTAALPPLAPPLPTPPQRPLRTIAPTEAPAFFRVVWSAFAYPFHGDGLVLLVAGTVFFSIINLATFFAHFAGLFGLAAIGILIVIGTGYLTCYLRLIITGTAIGEKHMPDWPDVSDVGSDIVAPFLQLLGTILASFLPAIIVSWYYASQNITPGWVLLLALGFGTLYFPMAFLAVAMLDTIAAVNPLVIMPPILRLPGPYFFCFMLFCIGLVLRLGGTPYFVQLIPIKPLAAVIAGFAELYFLVVGVRVLGLLYWTNKEEFGWLGR